MNKTHKIKPSVLKAYDIRGIVDKEITEVDAYFIGRGFGTILRKQNKKTCVLGYDGRHTSVPYSKECAKGLAECGIDVIVVGLLSTPGVYFAMKFLKADAGFIISASHNPKEYNGFKMLTQEGPFWDDDIQEIGRITESGSFIDGNGTITENEDIKSDYVKFLLSQLKPTKKQLNVVWDCGNGAVGAVINEVVSKLPGKHKIIYGDVDGDFPNHHPDPSVIKNLEDLKNEVLNGKFDLGVAFDGDGDRLGVVDETGNILYGDQLLLVFAREFLKTHKGEKVMSEVKASKVLYDDIEQHGGIPIMWKPGHSTIKAKMKSDNIKLAGETSGHIYWGENYNFDDGLYSSIKLLNILGNSDKTLGEIIKSLPKTYSTTEIRITVGDVEKFEITKKLAGNLRKENRDFIDVDGVRANLKDGWWLVRASNTQPDLTTRCEAISENGLEIVKKDLMKKLSEVGVEAKI